MEPDSLLRQPKKKPEAPRARSNLGGTLQDALAHFASHLADDAQAVEAVCDVVRPLLGVYGEPIAVEQWRDWHSLAVRRCLESEGQIERGLLIVDGMGHVLSEPRAAREEERWLLRAEARRHQICLANGSGLLLLAWKPAGMVSRGRLVLDHWRAAVRRLNPAELLANYPVEAFLSGLQEALTRRVERSRQWADFIRDLNQEFERVLD